MNYKQIIDLTSSLSQALDQNYDVVDMETVLSVIETLESATITKEQLETTRLAKYINQLRRRTKSEYLARRAKSLLKRWREMVGMQHQQKSIQITHSTGQSHSLNATRAVPTVHVIDPNTEVNNQFNSQCLKHEKISLNDTGRNEEKHIIQQIQQKTTLDQRNEDYIFSNSNKRAITSNKNTSVIVTVSGNKIPNFDDRPLCEDQKSRQQASTFSNLLSDLSSGSSSKLPANIFKSNLSSQLPIENVILDSTNSGFESLATDVFCTTDQNMPSIVIDLQDTNSTMDLPMTDESALHTCTIKITENSNADSVPKTKQRKKSKRLKKSKVRYNLANQIEIDDTSPSCIIQEHTFDDTHACKLQQMQHLDDENTRTACNISNISEMLSSSNSSIPSSFSLENIVNKETKSDLTFAGKFTSSSSIGDKNLMNTFLRYNFDQTASNSHVTVLNNNGNNTIVALDGCKNRKYILPNHQISTNYKHKIDELNNDDILNNDSTSNSRFLQKNLDEIGTNKPFIFNTKIPKKCKDMDNKLISSLPSIIPETLVTSKNCATVIKLVGEQTKKRGRKKMSKGIDLDIAKENSLSSQMMITGLVTCGKKVKTTKELYAEIRNRKQNIATTPSQLTTNDMPSSPKSSFNLMHEKHRTSPPNSSCSGSSTYSPFTPDIYSTNATMSTIVSRSTPEKFINKNNLEICNIESDSYCTSEMSVDSMQPAVNINNSGKITSYNVNDNQNLNVVDTTKTIDIINRQCVPMDVRSDLYELLKMLPTVDDNKNIEMEYAGTIPCTCTVVEVVTEQEHISKCTNDNETINEKIISNVKNELIDPQQKKIDDNFFQDIRTYKSSDIVNIENKRRMINKPQKSIFDLDFDDDEDPLLSIVADVTQENHIISNESKNNFSTEIKSNDQKKNICIEEKEKPLRANTKTEVCDKSDESIEYFCLQINEDPDCKAKYRYEIQTQQITKFHINALHNYFIPNINGNWNQSIAERISCINTENIINEKIIDGYSVVPRYGSLIKERISKDLSHLQFIKYNSHYIKDMFNKNTDNIWRIPFLGVSQNLHSNDFIFKRINYIETSNLQRKNNEPNLISNKHVCDDSKLSNNSNNHCKLQLNGSKNQFTNLVPEVEQPERYNGSKEDKSIEYKHNMEEYFHKILLNKTEKMDAYNNNINKVITNNKFITLCNSNMDKQCDTNRNLSDILNLKNSPISLNINKFGESSKKNKCVCRKRKIANDLFFDDELWSISQYSSENEYSDVDVEIVKSNKSFSLTKNNIIPDNATLKSLNECQTSTSTDMKIFESSQMDIDEGVTEPIRYEYADNCKDEIHNSDNSYDNDLPIENNKLLLSFNHIYYQPNVEYKVENVSSSRKLSTDGEYEYACKNMNFNLCNHINSNTCRNINDINSKNVSSSYDNISMNNNNNNIVNINMTNIEKSPSYTNYLCKKTEVISDNNINNSISREEYRIGLRRINDDVRHSDQNTGDLQEFKEWHEVLQLRSFNNELLTVLPYVLLE